MLLAWGCRPALADLLIVSDFKTGAYQFNGRNVALDEIWCPWPIGVVTFDPSVDIVPGTGLTFASDLPSQNGVGPVLLDAIFALLDIEKGFTVVSEIAVTNSGIFPDQNTVISNVNFDYWGFFDDQYGRFVWDSLGDRYVPAALNDVETNGFHRIAMTLGAAGLQYSVDGAPASDIVVPAGVVDPMIFFGLYVGSTWADGGGSCVSTMEKVLIYRTPRWGADLAALSS